MKRSCGAGAEEGSVAQPCDLGKYFLSRVSPRFFSVFIKASDGLVAAAVSDEGMVAGIDCN